MAATSWRILWYICGCIPDRRLRLHVVEMATTLSWSWTAVNEWLMTTSILLSSLYWVKKTNWVLIQHRGKLAVSSASHSQQCRESWRKICFKKCRATELTEVNKLTRLRCAQPLLRKYPASLVNFIVFTDEKVFTVARPSSNTQNDRVYARDGTCKKEVPAARLLHTGLTFSRSVAHRQTLRTTEYTHVKARVRKKCRLRGCCVRAWHSVVLSWSRSACQRSVERVFTLSSLAWRSTDSTTGILYCCKVFCRKFANCLNTLFFQQDSAPAHRSRETVELLKAETSDFIPSTIWPPNSPDLSPDDYAVRSMMEEKVYQHRIKDVDELCECIVSAWDALDQRVIDAAVRQWRTRLRACIKAKGGYFEHSLS